jgi:outer membrane protein OmpA-like peptidoglycan-associated protein
MARAARISAPVALAVWLATGLAAAQDHPLLSKYPGSTLAKREARDFDRYALVIGLDTKGMQFETRPLEGKLTRLVYTNPAGRSTLEIFENYRTALEGASARVLFACEMNTCGPAYARSAWNQANGLFAASDGDPRYLAAHLAAKGGEAYVAVMVGKKRTQVDVLERAAMDTGLVAVNAEALAKGIQQDGAARVYGILFDVDKADIRPESKAALEAIAELLRGQAALSIFVVGHTDATGALDHNLKLSRARAQAVVGALVGQYGIAAARLDPHGLGPLAPVASNATDEGRQKNRRVELVAR